MYKKICFCSMLLIFLSNSYALGIEEVKLEQEKNVLYGGINEKEIYSLSNMAEPIQSSGASVDVITIDDIKNQGSPVFAQLLNQVAGLTIQNANGSMGSPSSVRMRGVDRVRFTMDGMRVDRPSMTSPGIEPQFYMSDDIERIEVIRGPQGNVSGVNASGGLIAVQTRRGRGPLSIETGSEMGNYGAFKERFAVMGGDEKKDYYLGLTWLKNDGGMKVTDLGRIRNDDYNNLHLVSNIGMRVLEGKAEVRDVFRFSRARKDIGVGYDNWTYAPYQSPNSYAKNIDIMNVVSFDHTPKDWYNYTTRFGLYHNNSDNLILPDSINSDATYESLSKISSTRLNFLTQHNVKYKDWNTLSLGYNLESEFISSDSSDTSWGSILNNKFNGNTIQNDIFLNDVINVKDKLFLRGGARLVNNSAFGTYVLPNGSAALVLPTFKIEGAKTKFRGSWGQSVNTPTLYQRFARMNFGWASLLPNPNLKAEDMTGWDAGVEQSFFNDKLSFDFGYFNNDYKNYIGYYTDPITWNGTYKNINSARIQGYEGRATWTPNEKFKATVNYTYTDSEDKETGMNLPACPNNRINGTLYWTPHERFNAFAGIETASSRTMSSQSTTRAPGYTDVRLGTNIRLFSYKDANVYFRGTIYNLLNQKISMYRSGNTSYYAPGIHFMAGIFVKYNLPEKTL